MKNSLKCTVYYIQQTKLKKYIQFILKKRTKEDYSITREVIAIKTVHKKLQDAGLFNGFLYFLRSRNFLNRLSLISFISIYYPIIFDFVVVVVHSISFYPYIFL